MAELTTGAFINWDEKFLLNISEIDTHHEKLVDLINELYNGVFECTDIAQESELTERTLVKLQDYTKYHFSAEEKMMLELDYPAYMAHKHEHEYFIKQLTELMVKQKAGEMALSFSAFIFIKEWITNHILKTDKSFGQYIKLSVEE